MKFYNELKKLKRYFNITDLLVFCIIALCVVFLSIFNNKASAIVTNIVVSVFAAGVFYYFTAFIPRISEIKRMKKNIESLLKRSGIIVFVIIRLIRKGETKESYSSIMEFMTAMAYNEEEVKKSFFASFTKPKQLEGLKKSIEIQKANIEYIVINYSHLLPKKITLDLAEFCNLTFKQIDFMDSIGEKRELIIEQYYDVFKELLRNIATLKLFLKIKMD